MKLACVIALFLAVPSSGNRFLRSSSTSTEARSSAEADAETEVEADLKHRMQLQNKLAGVCEDMCKEVGAYPKCTQCPKFVAPDSTPGVMTWEELLEHMDNLEQWGQSKLKDWTKQASAASALQEASAETERACMQEDLKHRMHLQTQLAGVCEDMCKEVGAYPKCTQCPKFVAPDSTPGVMTWPELLEHMDNLVAWGQGKLKDWSKQASAVQVSAAHAQAQQSQSCAVQDMQYRSQLQNKLAGVCEDMCKEVGAYPKCTQCPKFVAPDSTPGVMTWPELLEHMDNLVEWGQGMIKGWNKQSSAVQVTALQKSTLSENACNQEDAKHRMHVQNQLAGVCEDMCKEVGAYPKCTQCPKFVAPDSTPGVMTWPELLEHMDNLVAWGQGKLKDWNKQASAVQVSGGADQQSCLVQDMQYRTVLQNKLASLCEDMCKEIGAYPKCTQCPKFVAPDSTPGVMTWPELLEHMDNLVSWGQGMIKGWNKQASAVQVTALQKSDSNTGKKDAVTVTADLKHRTDVQNKLAGMCEDMCKEVGAYPKCTQCPKFVAPDSTPGVMTWDELLEHMDNLGEWGRGMLKGWNKQASR